MLHASDLGIGASDLAPGGFTLIEVLLATSIFAIVLVAINTVFFAALHLRQRAAAALDESRPLDQALTLLRRDLQNAISPGGVLAGNFRGGNPSGTMTGTGTTTTSSGAAAGGQGTSQMGGLDFFTSTGTLSDDAPWGDIQEVNYQLTEPLDRSTALGRDLVRSVTRNLLATSAQTTEVQRLMSNVEDLQFYYYDGTQWRDAWDTSMGDSGLPAAVRVRVQPALDPASGSRRLEPIEMVVLLDTQSSTNQTQSATNSATVGGSL